MKFKTTKMVSMRLRTRKMCRISATNYFNPMGKAPKNDLRFPVISGRQPCKKYANALETV